MDSLSSIPRFPPSIYGTHATALPLSPRRRNQTSEDDRLRDLSPSTTLRAFAEDYIPPSEGDEYKILACVKTASASEKDLGARVARAAQKLKSWCKEIEEWGWSGTFKPPITSFQNAIRGESYAEHERGLAEGAKANDTPPTFQYRGSLPSMTIRAYEDRIEEIMEQLEQLDVEELKGHILSIHGPSRSRPTSSYGVARQLQFLPLDDFSILITQTLLQALPYLSQLTHNIAIWSSRLAVLREVPGFLKDSDKTREAIRLGWEVIRAPFDPASSEEVFSRWREAIDTVKSVLKKEVGKLGRQLDGMLDALEGHNDVLPDEWIEEFEALEAEYSRWVVEAQKRVFEMEILRLKSPRKPRTPDGVPSSKSLATDADSFIPSENPLGNVSAESNGHSTDLTSSAFDLGLRATINGIDGSLEQGPPATVGSIPSYELKHPNSHPPDTPKSQEHDSEPFDEHSEIIYHPGATTGAQNQKETDDDELTKSGPRSSPIRKASTTSIESFSRAQVRSIQVRRHSSGSSASVRTTTGDEARTHASPLNAEHSSSRKYSQPSSPLAVPNDANVTGETEDIVDPRTPHLRDRSPSLSSVASSGSRPDSPTADESPSVRTNAGRPQAKLPRPPLNSVMVKRRMRDSEDPKWPPTQFLSAMTNQADGVSDTPGLKVPTKPDDRDDELDRQISNILTSIPAHIRLTSSNEADGAKTRTPRVMSGGRAMHSLRAQRSFVKSPEMTLSPAKSEEPSARRHGGSDTDIKLYHLTQPGKDKPIKLFIRRVGENGERVMVRVGGGWADLGEYLRQYAEHHGRRTVSEGKFEVLGLSQEVITPRPGSAQSSRMRSVTPTPNKLPTVEDTPEGSRPITPAAVVVPISTPDSAGSRASWRGDEVGLAGPKTKKPDLSGDKLEWVEGMMNQARRLSSGAGNKVDFGDLGKVGGTKRVFLKNPGAVE